MYAASASITDARRRTLAWRLWGAEVGYRGSGVTLDGYEQIREAMEAIDGIARSRAAESWGRLPDSAREALTQQGFDERLWGPSFGYELGRFLRTGVTGPESASAAIVRALSLDDVAVDELAQEHVNRVLAGRDSTLNLAAASAFMDAVSNPSGPLPPDAPRRSLRSHQVRTPFDDLVNRIWPDDRDDIRILGVRLAGGFELVAGAVLLLLVWVPGTLAVTYRLLHREVSPGNLAKAVIGWLGIIAVITWLVTPR